MKRFALPFLLVLTLALTACTSSQTITDSPARSLQTPSQPAPVLEVTATPTDDPALLPTLFPSSNNNADTTRTDEQGMVVVEVTPLNLGTPADTLEFDVAMNTHSVDLSMDLASLATLTTDTGITVQATTWDAPSGGHHVEGKLIFPATKDGKPILEGAAKITLAIADVDAPSRVFEWDLK